MTIKATPDNILDKILKLFGKEREVIPPENADSIYKKHGQYAYIKGEKESLWKALFRRKNIF
ncbi:MAG: hypothetical protein V1872_11685 [bacterium]